MEFISKPKTVNAIQFTGENAGDVFCFINDFSPRYWGIGSSAEQNHEDGKPVINITNYDGGWNSENLIARVGDWIVYTRRGIEVESKDSFDENYAQVGDV